MSKQFFISLAALWAFGSVAAPGTQACEGYATSDTAAQTRLLLKIGAATVPELTARIHEVTAQLGYANVGLTLIANCPEHGNNAEIDYELIRRAILERLQERGAQ